MNTIKFASCLSALAAFVMLPISCAAQSNTSPLPPPAEVHTRGIIVSAPKIYDDYYLQTLLSSLKNNLANLQVVDQTTLLSHIGNTQGGDMRQLGVAVSAGGPSTPQVSTFSLAPNVPAFMVPTNPVGATSAPTATATATTPGTTTTQNSVAPTAPTPPAPSLSLPSFGQSSLDTFNESLQLSAEIMNVQLLLDGALTDRLQRSNGQPRATYSIGFPVTIENATTADSKHQNEIAEIRVDVCPAALLRSDPPSIVTLLPKEQTYNVASLVDKSFLGSISALLGGAINVGAGILWGHKTFYMVQQQETVAYQNVTQRMCGQGVPAASFSWQIRPVLGSKHVRPGMSQEFVQVSFPRDYAEGKNVTVGDAWITVGWRKTTDKGNLVGEKLEDSTDPVRFDLPDYKTTPADQTVQVSDIGQGYVAVKVKGTFLPGVLVRIGSRVIAPVVSSKSDSLSFATFAQELVRADGATLLSRGSEETPLLQNVVSALGCVAAAPPTAGASAPAATAPPATPLKINRQAVRITPYSDTLARIEFPYTQPTGLIASCILGNESSFSDPAYNPWVVTIGDKVFGLRDNPFLESSNGMIKLIAPNDLLWANRRIELRKLLWLNQYYRDAYILSDDQFPLGGLSVSKMSTLSTSAGLEMAVTGAGLDHAILRYPSCPNCVIQPIGPTYARILLPKVLAVPATGKDGKATEEKDPSKDLKQVVLCRGTAKDASNCDDGYLPLVLDIPKDDSAAKPAPFKVEAPVLLTAKQIRIAGDQVPKVALVEYQKTQTTFQLSADKKPMLIVDLPPSIVGRAGTYVLVITLDDKTTQVVPVTIKAPDNNG